MSVLTRWLGGKGPQLNSSPFRALASVCMERPERVIVATIDDNGTPRVGLAFEQAGVLVEVRLTDPDLTLSELREACAWRRKGSSSADSERSRP